MGASFPGSRTSGKLLGNGILYSLLCYRLGRRHRAPCCSIKTGKRALNACIYSRPKRCSKTILIKWCIISKIQSPLDIHSSSLIRSFTSFTVHISGPGVSAQGSHNYQPVLMQFLYIVQRQLVTCHICDSPWKPLKNSRLPPPIAKDGTPYDRRNSTFSTDECGADCCKSAEFRIQPVDTS